MSYSLLFVQIIITLFRMRNHNNYFAVPFDKCRASYVEHVEVLLKVNNLHAGQIKWDLISPYGTKSTVLPGRGLDSTTNMDLTVLTVQMWGENSIGYWKLEPSPVFGKRLGSYTLLSCRCFKPQNTT